MKLIFRSRHSLILLLALTLSGCQALYFVTGKGQQEALYKLPPGRRVLVLVDPRPGSRMPSDMAYRLGEKLSDHLYKFKAADLLVAQQRLAEIRRRPDYDQMGIADIAAATDADVVVCVDVAQFSTTSTSDDQVMQGAAVAVVKVLDRSGNRLWPTGGVVGMPAEARAELALTDQRDRNALNKELLDLLDMRIGRMFHPYDIEDKTMNK